MSYMRTRTSKSGFSFETRSGSLLAGLQFNLKFPNCEFDCQVVPNHSKRIHELDHIAEFLSERGQLLPEHSKDILAVSCKTNLSTREIDGAKTELLEAIECHNQIGQHLEGGLIMTSSILPGVAPELGNNILLWDLSRCFFYGWKSYYANHLNMPVNYHERHLMGKNTFIFGAGEPEKEINVGACEIFLDETGPLDQVALEKCLDKIFNFVKHGSLMKSGRIYVNVHTTSGFTTQVERNRNAIAASKSKEGIDFKLNEFYDYSVVPWDPLTTTLSRSYLGV